MMKEWIPLYLCQDGGQAENLKYQTSIEVNLSFAMTVKVSI